MKSNLLSVGDAVAEAVRREVLPTFPDAEVLSTWWGDRFDAKLSTGFKCYVTAVSDMPAPIEQGGARLGQPLYLIYALTFAERIPPAVDTRDAKDLWLRDRVDLVGRVRERLDNPRQYSLPGVECLAIAPTDTDEREAMDLDRLHETNIFCAWFVLTIREDP